LDINRFKKIKYVHWSPDCTLPRDKKFHLAIDCRSKSELTLQLDSGSTIKKIIEKIMEVVQKLNKIVKAIWTKL